MALLLRMGGVPAASSAGFTTGAYDAPRKQYVVSDTDAHAWVEVVVPALGWVTFDPTPARRSGPGGHVAARPRLSPATSPSRLAAHAVRQPEPAPPPSSTEHTVPIAAGGARAAAARRRCSRWSVLAARASRPTASRLRPSAPEEPLVELERALAALRSPARRRGDAGRARAALRRPPEAADYVRALRQARFAGGAAAADAAQRRALRAALAQRTRAAAAGCAPGGRCPRDRGADAGPGNARTLYT